MSRILSGTGTLKVVRIKIVLSLMNADSSYALSLLPTVTYSMCVEDLRAVVFQRRSRSIRGNELSLAFGILPKIRVREPAVFHEGMVSECGQLKC